MERKELFSIGEVSKMFHISISSLRHYELKGILTPAYISPESGYRYYGTEQFEVLNTIRYLRALDMPLAEIEDFLEKKDVERIEEKLIQQRRIVLNKKKELERIEKKINRRLTWLKEAQNIPLDEISLVNLPVTRVAWLEDPLWINGYSDMETPIRKLDRSDAEAVVFLGKVGLGITPEHLERCLVERYDSIFLTLDKEDIYTEKTVTLPETQAVRLHFRGGHTEARKQYIKLVDYIQSHRMKISGFSREVTLIDYGITDDKEKFVTEICIPVVCE